APAALPTRAPIARAAAGLEPQVGRERIAGRTYLVHTQRRGDTVVQVAMDLRYQAAERRRLLRTLAGVEAAGLLAALLIGQFAARRAIAPLGEALARQRRFTAEVSHELRTPLTRLHTRTQLLARRLRGGTDVGPEMEQLVAGTRQLAEVVEDLLLSAELGRPGRPGRPFPLVDLAVLAEEQVAAEAPRAAARGVTIEVRRQGAVHVVRGAESALRRVISALLDNALGHTAGHIWLTLSAGPETVQVTVQDDGAGLDGRDTERLFIRYVRGERAEPRGFGLGLALAREVVDGHGGTITAHCPPGTGAVFTVRLPAARSRCD
uniref:sensor histidine kinase n=1 Tax=Actinomadura roseirufa TaxID=2094049 RepID=UPI001041094C